MKKHIKSLAIMLSMLMLITSLNISANARHLSDSSNVLSYEESRVNLHEAWEEAVDLKGEPAVDWRVNEEPIYDDALLDEQDIIMPGFKGSEKDVAAQQIQFVRYKEIQTGDNKDQRSNSGLNAAQDKLERMREYENEKKELEKQYAQLTIDDLVEQFQVDESLITEQLSKGFTIPSLFTMLWEEQGAAHGALSKEALKNLKKRAPSEPKNLSDEDTLELNTLHREKVAVQEERAGKESYETVDLRTLKDGASVTGDLSNEKKKEGLVSIQSSEPEPEMIEIPTFKNSQAPYQVSLHGENVSLLTGGISIVADDFTLPGRNGLSFTLQRSYDSNSAQKYDMDVGYSYTYGYYFDYITSFRTRDKHYGVEQIYHVTVEKYLCVNNQKTGGVVWTGPKPNAVDIREPFTTLDDANYAASHPLSKPNEVVHPCGTYGNPSNYIYELKYTPAGNGLDYYFYKPWTSYSSFENSSPLYANYAAALQAQNNKKSGAENESGTGGSSSAGYYQYEINYSSHSGIFSAVIDATAYNQTKDNPIDKKNPIGKGWSWNIPYMKFENGKKYVTVGDGMYEVSGTSLVNYPWSDMSFQTNTSVSYGGRQSAYALASIYDMKHYFDADGNIIQIQDNYDNTIRFAYSTHSTYGTVLTSIKDVLDNEILINYTGSQVVITLGDRTITYHKETQEGKEVLRSVVDPLSRTTSYYYEYKPASFNLAGGSDSSNPYYLLDYVVHPTGAISDYTYNDLPVKRYVGNSQYNQAYKLAERKDIQVLEDETEEIYNISILAYTGDMASSYNQDYTFSTTLITDLIESKMTYQKDYVNDTVGSTYYNIQSSTTDGTITKITNMTFNTAKRRPQPNTTSSYLKNESTSETTVPITSAVKYDDYRNVISATNPLNATSTYAYDATTKRLVSSVEPVDGTQILYTEIVSRNNKGDITEMRVRETNASGAILQHMQYDYDIHGNMTLVRQLDTDRNRETYIEYSSLYHSGFPTKITRPYTQLQSPQFNWSTGIVKNQILEGTYEKETGLLMSYKDGNGNITTYDYDDLGRLILQMNPDGSTIEHTIHDLDNTIIIQDELERKSYIKWNALGWEIESGILNAGTELLKNWKSYDSFGRLSVTGDANLVQTHYTYDDWNRTTAVGTNNEPNHTLITYDDLQFMTETRLKTEVTGGQDDLSRSTSDRLGRLIKKEQNINGAYEIVWRGLYDNANRLIQQWDGENNLTTNTFDSLGRLRSVTGANGHTYNYTYNRAGMLTSTTYPILDGVGATPVSLKEYDELGQLVKATNPGLQYEYYMYDENGNRESYYDKKGQHFTYTYNNRNFLTDKISPNDYIGYSYNEDGTRDTMTDNGNRVTEYMYDPITGALKEIQFPDGNVLSYGYDAMNLRTQMNMPFADVVEYKYDTQNRLDEVKWNSSLVVSYSYNGKGQIHEALMANGLSSTYEFENGRMNSVETEYNSLPISQYAYTYDLSGNALTRATTLGGQTVTDAFTYDEMNRIESSSLFNELYSYDEPGNRQTLKTDQVMQLPDAVSYEYDDWDRLVKVTKADASEIGYVYNGDNLLTERTENGVTTRYYYDGQLLIAEGIVQSDGSVEEKVSYLHGNGPTMLENAIGTKGYYIRNAHGDVVGIYDQSGNPLNTYEYDIWGKTLSVTETVHNVFRYSGEYWDESTQLQYLRARWYDPSEGRFINEDTYEGELTNPLTLNLYTYVSNNPLRYIDPSGHIQLEDWTTLSPENLKDVLILTGRYNKYKEQGNTKMMNQMHLEAEAIRDRNLVEMANAVEQQIIKALNEEAAKQLIVDLLIDWSMEKASAAPKNGKGNYKDTGGHHVHSKAAFKNHINYDSDTGFSISQDFMSNMGLNHQAMTNKQRELFKDLHTSGRPNVMKEHSRIAVEALEAGGASRQMARSLVAESLLNLRSQYVSNPTNIPWYK